MRTSDVYLCPCCAKFTHMEWRGMNPEAACPQCGVMVNLDIIKPYEGPVEAITVHT